MLPCPRRPQHATASRTASSSTRIRRWVHVHVALPDCISRFASVCATRRAALPHTAGGSTHGLLHAVCTAHCEQAAPRLTQIHNCTPWTAARRPNQHPPTHPHPHTHTHTHAHTHTLTHMCCPPSTPAPARTPLPAAAAAPPQAGLVGPAQRPPQSARCRPPPPPPHPPRSRPPLRPSGAPAPERCR